jgi:uncharacterized protein (TIGR02145 family)
MRTKILVLFAITLALSANLRAQVTVGGLTTPKAGALLDLNSTIPGGLLLSNVDLDDLSKIPANRFVGISATQDRNLELAGMIVYNTNTTTGIGIHVWDGEDWIKPCAPPAPEAITFSGTTICGSTFTAKIDSVKGATSYVWSLPDGLTGTSNDTIITITAATAGTYAADSITVRAVSSCGGGTRRTGAQEIVINAIPAAPTNPRVTNVSGNNFKFEADPPSGYTIDWYAVPSGGSPISGGSNTSSLVVNNLTTRTTYYAESRNLTTGCVSNSRLTITGLPVVSGCATTPSFNVVITPANVAFVNDNLPAYSARNGITLSTPVKIVGLPARTTEFNGASSGSYKADYRDHQVSGTDATNDTDDYGSWFSWCMVVQYADILCPSPWRVPTTGNLCKYSSGNETTHADNHAIIGGTHDSPGVDGWLISGFAGDASTKYVNGFYWSSTAYSSTHAHSAYVSSSLFDPQNNSIKTRDSGFSLRCVK